MTSYVTLRDKWVCCLYPLLQPPHMLHLHIMAPPPPCLMDDSTQKCCELCFQHLHCGLSNRVESFNKSDNLKTKLVSERITKLPEQTKSPTFSLFTVTETRRLSLSNGISKIRHCLSTINNICHRLMVNASLLGKQTIYATLRKKITNSTIFSGIIYFLIHASLNYCLYWYIFDYVEAVGPFFWFCLGHNFFLDRIRSTTVISP